jgi:GNAT superfamily N-acetyltransferase
MNVEIREVLETDLPQLLPLYGQLGMDSGEVLPLAEAHRLYRRIKSYPDYRIYCAQWNGALVGVFALLVMDNLGHMGRPSAILEDVVVDRRWRGCGIGRQMIAWALERCNKKDCYKLSLSSDRRRKEAHGFYERLGFKRHGYSYAVFLEDMEPPTS